MQDRRAESPNEPEEDARGVERLQVVGVLDERETGADRESVNRGVDGEPDAVAANQVDDEQALDRLLRRRREVARERRVTDVERVDQPPVYEQAGDGGRAAGQDRADDDAQRHELVAVQHHEHGEEDENRHEADRNAKQLAHRIFSETMTSSP